MKIIIFGAIEATRDEDETKEIMIKEIYDDPKENETTKKMFKLSSEKGITEEDVKKEFVRIIEKYFNEFV